jgi:hypothetical protein
MICRRTMSCMGTLFLYGHVILVWARYSVFPLVGPTAAAGSLLSWTTGGHPHGSCLSIFTAICLPLSSSLLVFISTELWCNHYLWKENKRRLIRKTNTYLNSCSGVKCIDNIVVFIVTCTVSKMSAVYLTVYLTMMGKCHYLDLV